MKLLIAEDDTRLLKSLVYVFTNNNYSVDGVTNGSDALSYALSDEYDGIILDNMMPGLSGLEVLKELRSAGKSVPILFLSAASEVEDKIKGLDLGADDYLGKPFSSDELLARVRAMLRRKSNYTPDIVILANTSIDRGSYIMSCGEESCQLSSKEFQILDLLIEMNGSLVSIEKIITHIWGWDAEVDSSVIWVHISNIRKKFYQVGSNLDIRFIRGGGYILEVPS